MNDEYTRIVSPASPSEAKAKLDEWLATNHLTLQQVGDFILQDIVRGGDHKLKHGYRIQTKKLHKILQENRQ